MNPFSRLRSPICSSKFDDGVLKLARSFNDMALSERRFSKSSVTTEEEDVEEEEVGSDPVGVGRKSKDGLSWL